jgi:hypothetical protein
MLNRHFRQALSRNLVSTQTRQFGYDIKEIEAMNAALQRKLNVLRMFTEYKDFNYEQPQMDYDKATGNVTILDPRDRVKPKKKIITSVDEIN